MEIKTNEDGSIEFYCLSNFYFNLIFNLNLRKNS